MLPSLTDHSCFNCPAELGLMAVSVLLNPVRAGSCKYVDQSPGPAAFAGLWVFRMPARDTEPSKKTNKRARLRVRRFLDISCFYLPKARCLFWFHITKQAV